MFDVGIGSRQLENTNLGGIGTDRYSCNFGFQQFVYSTSKIPTIDEVFDPNGGVVELTNRCGIDTACSIVAGSNSIEPVQVTVNNIDPSGDIQTKLENAASPEASSVFNPFPTGGFGESGELRNPLEVCQAEYGCPTYN